MRCKTGFFARFVASPALLLHFGGSNNSTSITDSSPASVSLTASGNAVISTAESKFGGSSLALDGDGDYVSTTAPVPLGAGSFTIEAWVFVDSASSGTRPIASAYDLEDQQTNPYPIAKWLLYIDSNGDLSFLGDDGNGAAWPLASLGASVPTDQWVHVAVTRSSGGLHLFVDGVEDTTNVTSPELNIPVADVTAVGQVLENGVNAAYFQGYIDEVRIILGRAMYPASGFTPPTAAF